MELHFRETPRLKASHSLFRQNHNATDEQGSKKSLPPAATVRRGPGPASWGRGRGVLPALEARSTRTCVVFCPAKSHASVNNCDAFPGMQLTCVKHGGPGVLCVNLKRWVQGTLIQRGTKRREDGALHGARPLPDGLLGP